MKALRSQQGKLSLNDISMPERRDEALVRVLKSGICNTDLEIVRGYAGFEGTIGHEFVGMVEIGDMKGKRVVGEINVGCGNCDLCKAGDPRHCPERTVLGIHGRDGAHSEFLTLPARNLIKVPDNVSDEEAVFVEPLAAAYGISEQVEIRSETKVAVVGDGKLGLLSAFSMRLLSDNVVLVGKHQEKLDHARRRDIETVMLENTAPLDKRFDVVVEASGAESGFATALALVRPRGKLVLKSTFHGKPAWEAWRVVVDEITVVGSRCGRFAPVLDLLASKRIQVDDLISDEFGLVKGVQAVRRAAEKGVMKVLLDPTA
ncbi:MAG TPA: alcohol dehydrogenase catalytic domain-containing protein [Pyrinomonadaceae bacterium]|jgi:threonine dehydrogenase-like Zn-dependent dehydrogenase|nr:alcohol dehydrogenase catalytic domain-containing protein [Pyrinomonadaceae bacterium]